MNKVLKQKVLCDGKILLLKYDKLIQIIRDNKVEYHHKVPDNNLLTLPTGETVIYDERVGFPFDKYWVNTFDLPSQSFSSVEVEQ